MPVDPERRRHRFAAIRPYVRTMRVDYWFKNVFMLMGTIAAVAAGQAHLSAALVWQTTLVFGLTCCAASANYILNEIVDAPFDRVHPVKRLRPVAQGVVSTPICAVLGCSLAAISLAGARLLFEGRVVQSLAFLLVMGVLYNVPPFRTKDVPYLDALSEAVNNPIRLLIGWFGAGAQTWPPSSLIFAYWAIGAFLMTAKRFAELRFIGTTNASAYRVTFARYTEEGLLIGMIVYVSLTTFLYGVVALKYHPELLLGLPLVLIFIGWFFHLAFETNSIVKDPEQLIRKPAFLAYCLVVLAVLVELTTIRLPMMLRFLGLGS
jgi:decaprenyl-phosphate phosphoribosyltransferase